MSEYKVSIVVCSYNRANILQHCLQSLVEQDAARNQYEVIVIDNNSTDGTERIANEFARKYNNFRVLREEKQGLSYARNRGFKEADTDYVAYLDDDAKPFKQFVGRIIWIIENYNFDAFGGRYIPWYIEAKPKWFLNEYGSNGYKLKKIGELKHEFIDGGVSVFNKRVVESLGGFSTKLGMSGKRISYGEETNLQIRMRQNGFRIGFDPDLVVEHLVPVYKYRVWWFFKSAYVSGRDSWIIFDLMPTCATILRRTAGLGYKLLNLIKFTMKLAQEDYFFQNWCIDTICPILYSIGSIGSGIKIILDRKAQYCACDKIRQIKKVL